MFCKAADVRENAHLYPGLSDEVWQAALVISNQGDSTSVTDENVLNLLISQSRNDWVVVDRGVLNPV